MANEVRQDPRAHYGALSLTCAADLGTGIAASHVSKVFQGSVLNPSGWRWTRRGMYSCLEGTTSFGSRSESGRIRRSTIRCGISRDRQHIPTLRRPSHVGDTCGMPVDNQIYDRLAATWWRPGSALGGLDTLNPGRFAYLDRVLGARGLRYGDLEVLDLGCGGGLMSEAYARRGARVTGVDPSNASLKVARAHAHESGLSIRYERGLGEALPFPNASFDLVSCCDVLEHVDDLDTVSRQIARVLRPGGLFFFDTINRTWLSWLFVIEVFQEWLHLIPPGTHDWDMFIVPAELRASLARAGLDLRDLTGLGPSLDPLGLGRALLHRATGRLDHRDALALVGPSPFASLLYMGWATTQTRGPRRRHPRRSPPKP